MENMGKYLERLFYLYVGIVEYSLNITFFWTWVVIIAPVVLRIEWPIFRGVSKVGIDDLKGWSTRMIPLVGLGKHQELGRISPWTWPNLLGSCQKRGHPSKFSMVNICRKPLRNHHIFIFPYMSHIEQHLFWETPFLEPPKCLKMNTKIPTIQWIIFPSYPHQNDDFPR